MHVTSTNKVYIGTGQCWRTVRNICDTRAAMYKLLTIENIDSPW